MYNVVALMSTRNVPVYSQKLEGSGFWETFSSRLASVKDHFFRATFTGTTIALMFNSLDNTIVRRQTGTVIPEPPKLFTDKLIHAADKHSKGLGCAIAKQVVLNTSLAFSMILLENTMDDLCGKGPLNKMLTGMGAGAFQAYISSPLSTILVRLQTDTELPKLGGGVNLRQFLAGATSTAARNSLFWSIFLASTHAVEEKVKAQEQHAAKFAIASPVLCSLGASMLTTPIATISNCQRKSAAGFWTAAAQIVQKRGVRGLYAGAGLGMIRMAGVGTLTHFSKGAISSEVPTDHEAESLFHMMV
ncbi:MAG: hypothetical protein K0Q57_229 [Gammaproteobacteria bacterium]|jgi:hypothetical protein|nr:hypothetical protein [Gammaproteobacteria bacterium]